MQNKNENIQIQIKYIPNNKSFDNQYPQGTLSESFEVYQKVFGLPAATGRVL